VQATAQRNQCFHWPLEFPHIFAAGGFDVMLGNPPWERIKLQEQEFFAAYDPDIANAANKAARQKLIGALPQRNPALAAAFAEAKYAAEAQSRFVRGSGRFPLTAVGDVNTYALFAELVRDLLAPMGRVGIIVPTGIATDDTTKQFFADLVEQQTLVQYTGFENEALIFPAVHHAFKFCIIVISGAAAKTQEAGIAFFCRNYDHVRQPERRFALTRESVALINPNTKTCPIFRSRADAILTEQIFRRVPVLLREVTGQSPWQIQIYRAIDLFRLGHSGISSDEAFQMGKRSTTRDLLAERSGLFPLFESKLIHQFDHRYATYSGVGSDELRNGRPHEQRLDAKLDPSLTTVPRQWFSVDLVGNLLRDKTDRLWLIAFRDVTNATNERSAIGTIIPYSASDYSVRLVFTEKNQAASCSTLLANLNSLVFDYVVRQKLAGMHLSDYIIAQLPCLPPSAFEGAEIAFIVPRVLELTYTAWDLAPFAVDLWADADDELRARLLAQHEANRAATGGHPWAPPAWANLPARTARHPARSRPSNGTTTAARCCAPNWTPTTPGSTG
jgi:hypothetical protein